MVSFQSTSLLVPISNALGEQASTLYARGLYSTDQMARLTRFTTSGDGATPGVQHAVFSKMNLEGDLLSTTTETAMATPGGTRRQPEEQEINALMMHSSASPYNRPTTSARWTGSYAPAAAGDYVVFVQTDGRYRLLIDDKVVFDSTVVPKYILNQANLPLSQAPHKVVLEQIAQQIASVSGLRVGIAPVSTLVDPDALAIAQKADAVVLAVGFNNTSESEGGDRSFELPVGQDALIHQVAALHKKTIVAITGGGSVDMAP